MEQARDNKLIFELAQSIHVNAIEKGFWSDDSITLEERLMLVITELAEAVEADRHKNWLPKSQWMVDCLSSDYTHKDFTCYIKGSVEEEIADAIIRTLDIMQGYDLAYNGSKMYPIDGKFARDMFFITSDITAVLGFDADDFSNIVGGLYRIADYYDMHVDTIIKWKMEYNMTRARLHGKEY